MWLRDEQIKLAIARNLPRIQPCDEDRDVPIAVVCYGPSLADTWEKIKEFKYTVTCSGSHKFLVERGITPTWHVEVDPRSHKTKLIGQPQNETEYLIASTCHPEVFDLLKGYNVKLWHVFDNDQEAQRVLPPGEWAITGGCDVGLRAMSIARFFGFKELHVFGKDGCEGPTGKHAAYHPNQAPAEAAFVEYEGKKYYTTSSFLTAAQQTFHELDQMRDVKATFYGEGLVQAMVKNYVPKHPEGKTILGMAKPVLISAEYLQLNEQLHRENIAYGVGGDKHVKTVLQLAESLKTKNILDYGCGKGRLARGIPWAISEYDPAIAGKTESPKPADLVVCTDVLEHIEPDKLVAVLDDLRRCVRSIGYFTINTGPAKKYLADGRNTHLIQRNKEWWAKMLSKFFTIGKIIPVNAELYVVVSPKMRKHNGD